MNMQPSAPTVNFWNRPEGTTGKIIVAGLIGLGGMALYKILPFLITIAENTLYLGVLGIGIVGLYMLVTSERVRTLIFYALAIISRAITSMFIDIDPIAILEAFNKQMRERRKVVMESIDAMLGVSRSLEAEIDRGNKEMAKALNLADAASDSGNEDVFNAQTEIAGRRADLVERYMVAMADVKEVVDALRKVKSRADYHITTSEDEVTELKRQYEIAKKTQAATKAATAIFGDSDLLDVRNAAADRIREKYASALGELDGYLESAKGIDAEIDLNRVVFQAEGKKRLNELRQKLSKSAAPAQLTSGPAQVNINTSSDYANIVALSGMKK